MAFLLFFLCNACQNPYSKQIQIIKDEYPKIQINSIIDSLHNIILFDGNISDDYSVTKLTFNYEVSRKDSVLKLSQETTFPFVRGQIT